jgi:hypothetical protein
LKTTRGRHLFRPPIRVRYDDVLYTILIILAIVALALYIVGRR